MRIVIPGGAGHVGRVLSAAFHQGGHDVIVLSRRPVARPWRIEPWDGRTLGGWAEAIDGCDAVINLAGRSVNCRYTPANRREILESRVFSTRVVGDAIAAARRPPRVWLQASTATIYAHRYDAANDEATGILGGAERDAPSTWRFSIDVARAWEQTLAEASTPRTRKVLMRSALTMSPTTGGVFDALVWLVRRALGGPTGDGAQFVSWIHHHDFVRSVEWLIARDDIEGPVNLASPNPVRNAEFMRVLRHALGVPIGLPVSKWMLEVGALFLRTETELVLKSRRVVPARLLAGGFTFKYATWPDAARDLCREWRARRGSGELRREVPGRSSVGAAPDPR